MYDAIIFDLDGTLIDSFEEIVVDDVVTMLETRIPTSNI